MNQHSSTDWATLYRAVVALVIGLTVGLLCQAAARYAKDQPRPTLSPNDRSRFLTIWALGDYGRYWIDDLTERPGWNTIDKIYRPDVKHFYSSKPPLLPTLLAYEYRLIKWLTGGAWTFERQPAAVVRTIVITTNVLPFLLFLVLFVRWMRREHGDGWVTFYALLVAGAGTYLTAFNVTLNNHTVAAYFGFFALYGFWPLLAGGAVGWLRAFVSGLCLAFAAACELPAVGFVVLVLLWVLVRRWQLALFAVLPAVAIVAAAFFYTNYQVTGDFKPAYMHKEWYDYEDSYWNEPKGIDAIREPATTYLFHLTLGHHGVLSLTPVFVYTLLGLMVAVRQGGAWRWLALVTVVLTVAVFAFYVGPPPLEKLAPIRRNYGGMTQGFRWSFWLIPLWLAFLPKGVAATGRTAAAYWLAFLLLAISAGSVFYAVRNPWTRPWLQELLYRYGYIDY